MWTLRIILLATLATGAALGQPLEVFVSVLPQTCFVERIGGAHVRAQALVPPGSNPATYEPTPRQLAALGKADLFFTIDVPFEQAFLGKVRANFPQLTIIDTAEGVPRREMVGHGHPGHERGEHDGALDPHIWLGPNEIRIQATTIAAALSKVDPAHAPECRDNLAAFLAEIDQIHAKIAKKLAPYAGQAFFVFHPSFGYFADAYGLRQVPIEIEGKSPTPKQLQKLIQLARTEGVKVIFVQPQFAGSGATAVAQAIGGTVVPLDPLAKDVPANLEDMAAKLVEALKK